MSKVTSMELDLSWSHSSCNEENSSENNIPFSSNPYNSNINESGLSKLPLEKNIILKDDTQLLSPFSISYNSSISQKNKYDNSTSESSLTTLTYSDSDLTNDQEQSNEFPKNVCTLSSSIYNILIKIESQSRTRKRL